MTPEELEAAIAMTTAINLEVYYYWCTAIMILIHAGFMMYEMGASRVKHVLASGTKNILAFAFMIPTFWMFGWWIYLAMINGFVPDFEAGAAGVPWSEWMGPNLADNASGVFWGAFTLFACTTASIMSGSVIERIRLSSFIILAVVLGSVVWILSAAWGWHPAGWMVTKWGYHDFGASGVVHIISGFFALGILIPLGPRVGRFNSDGSANVIRGHSLPMTMVGLMLIVVGFFGFLAGCLFYGGSAQWTNIYGMPTTLSTICFNTLMGVAGGMIGAYAMTRDPFWVMSGALCGIISVAAGMDLYYPGLTFALAFLGGVIGPISAKVVARFGVDDAVGAVSVHGTCGILGVLAVGIFAGGYPAFAEGVPTATFSGQFMGMLVMVALGFIPGYVLAMILKGFGVLRASDPVQEMGMDVEIENTAYPEGMASEL
jgi:ammonia channel protein AmtB